MTVTVPESISAEGNVKAVFVPTVADPAAPTAAELNGGVDLSCFLMPDWDGATATQNTGEDRRFCSKQTFSRLGRVSWEVSPLMYTYLPQALGEVGNAANEAYEALAAGNKGYLFFGYGIDPADPFVADDVTDGFPVECGVQSKAARGSDEFAPLTVTQTLAVIGPASLDAVVATA